MLEESNEALQVQSQTRAFLSVEFEQILLKLVNLQQVYLKSSLLHQVFLHLEGPLFSFLQFTSLISVCLQLVILHVASLKLILLHLADLDQFHYMLAVFQVIFLELLSQFPQFLAAHPLQLYQCPLKLSQYPCFSAIHPFTLSMFLSSQFLILRFHSCMVLVDLDIYKVHRPYNYMALAHMGHM